MNDGKQNDIRDRAIEPSAGLVGNLAAQRLFLLLASPDHKLGQMVRFGATSAISAIVTVGLPVVLHEIFDVAPQHGAALAFCVAFCLNFLSTRRLVFRSNRGALRDLLTFTASSIVFRIAEYLSFLILISWAHVYYIVALVGVLILSTVAKFLWYRRVMHPRQECPAAKSR